MRRWIEPRAWVIWIVIGVSAGPLVPQLAHAQTAIPGDRPADERLAVPRSEVESSAPPTRILPPYPIPSPDERPDRWAGRFVLRHVEVDTRELLSRTVVEEIVRPYLDRPVDSADLLELRDRLTLALVDRGFVTSGAVLVSTDPTSGVVIVRIVEGVLDGIDVETDGRFRKSVLLARLRDLESKPVDVRELERVLRALQRDRHVERVDAQLEPQLERGRSRLRVAVEEAPFVGVETRFDNSRSPSIGSLGGAIDFALYNLAGFGDDLRLTSERSKGLLQLGARYELPVHPSQTRVALHYRFSAADIVENPTARSFDLTTRSRTFGVTLRQPLGEVAGGALETFLRGELRRAKLTEGGVGLSFGDGPENGISKVTALRWGLEWTRAGQRSAVALRSLATFGLDALGATRRPGDRPDGQFVSWLAQAIWAQRLPWEGAELVVRSELQLANRALLSLEQIAIGGRHTIRGYRENARVGDEGFVASGELRLPIYRRIDPPLRLELIPFLDVGRVWNRDRPNGRDRTLASAGLGLRGSALGWLDAELFWGQALQRVDRQAHRDPQDEGVHFRVVIRIP